MRTFLTSPEHTTLSNMLETATRSWLGFDDVFGDLIKTLSSTSTQGGYPPFNLIKTEEDNYLLEVAVAGFEESDLDIYRKDDILTIQPSLRTKEEGNPVKYLVKNIAQRSFCLRFRLAKTIEVLSVDLTNGMLRIVLKNKKDESVIRYQVNQAVPKDGRQLLTE